MGAQDRQRQRAGVGRPILRLQVRRRQHGAGGRQDGQQEKRNENDGEHVSGSGWHVILRGRLQPR